MKTKLVLIERDDKTKDNICGSSGILMNNKYVITTSNFLSHGENSDGPNILEKFEPGIVYPELFSEHKITFNVVFNNKNGLFTVRKAQIFSVLISENIKKSSRQVFQNWAIDSIDNNRNLQDILSVLIVLTFDKTGNMEEFKSALKEWWYFVGHKNIEKADEICIKSTPFGNRNFINSFSQGIVSNIFGNNFCFILSDCSSTPGSEGSPVYLLNGQKSNADFPIGIVLSSLNWWRGEWVGLTLICDIRPLILEFVDIPIKTVDIDNKISNQKLLATVDFSLVQVYSGRNWGTAILLSQKKGIFITNSHVIDSNKITLYHRQTSWSADLIYKTSDETIFDLAIIRCKAEAIEELNLKPVSVSKTNIHLGDCVYSAGFPLFSKDCHPTATLTRGCISHTNPYMLKTTCCVQAGASGGAILDVNGDLLGVIVCNTKLHENNVTYPRVNMAVPIAAVADILFKYVEGEDKNVLKKLNTENKEALTVWKRLEGKL